MLIERLLPYALTVMILAMIATAWLVGTHTAQTKLVRAYIAGWQCGTQWHDAAQCHSEAKRIFNQ